ncbi:hypothetical protein BaRGS_00037786 [Batillaria attramentaria]|uniref:non-specific serine/threonine protein kinase n=1 Tax=Batillaria attramentaria TaxID=370345 RepID=A0ABD0J7M3_9CAEN
MIHGYQKYRNKTVQETPLLILITKLLETPLLILITKLLETPLLILITKLLETPLLILITKLLETPLLILITKLLETPLLILITKLLETPLLILITKLLETPLLILITKLLETPLLILITKLLETPLLILITKLLETPLLILITKLLETPLLILITKLLETPLLILITKLLETPLLILITKLLETPLLILITKLLETPLLILITKLLETPLLILITKLLETPLLILITKLLETPLLILITKLLETPLLILITKLLETPLLILITKLLETPLLILITKLLETPLLILITKLLETPLLILITKLLETPLLILITKLLETPLLILITKLLETPLLILITKLLETPLLILITKLLETPLLILITKLLETPLLILITKLLETPLLILITKLLETPLLILITKLLETPLLILITKLLETPLLILITKLFSHNDKTPLLILITKLLETPLLILITKLFSHNDKTPLLILITKLLETPLLILITKLLETPLLILITKLLETPLLILITKLLETPLLILITKLLETPLLILITKLLETPLLILITKLFSHNDKTPLLILITKLLETPLLILITKLLETPLLILITKLLETPLLILITKLLETPLLILITKLLETPLLILITKLLETPLLILITKLLETPLLILITKLLETPLLILITKLFSHNDYKKSLKLRARHPNTFPKSERTRVRSKVKDAPVKLSPSVQPPPTLPGSPPQPTLLQGQSIEEEETPVFQYSVDEWGDWKQTTLTGANIPFSPTDPRQPATLTSSLATPERALRKPPGKWLRKYSQGPLSPSDLPIQMVEFKRNLSYDLSPAEYQSDMEMGSMLGSADVSASEETDFDNSHEDPKPDVPTEPTNPITCIDVSSNQITSLLHLVSGGAEFVERLSTLQQLDLGNNMLDSLPAELFQSLPGLTHLSLSDNRLCAFPLDVTQCSALVHLDLAGNKITELDFRELTECLKVEELVLSGNRLVTFPGDLDTAMPHLQKLWLARNVIEVVPDAALALPDLRLLDLSHNHIKVIPDHFLTRCVKLETLQAANNMLELLPSETVAAGLMRLHTLRLSNNALSEKDPFFVPKFILELPKLEGLPPPTQWKTQILKELLVSQNNITKLNLEGAKAWSKLEKLHLARNKISESLDITHNKQLTTLPDELGRCDRLWEMPFDGLNLDLDVKITGGRVQDLRIYLHNRLKKAQDYYRMKLMVVGYGGRGKTSLLQALKKKVRQNTGDAPPVTVGVIVDEWKFERQRNGKSVTYTLSTWDFAGQEDFYSTHQCFLTNRTLYLVVYDISLGMEEVEKLKPWLSNIQARAPGCPVIIVGTHYDLLPPDTREEVLASFDAKLKDLALKAGFPTINCSAIVDLKKETPELERLRKKVFEIVDEYKVKGKPVMGQKVPASYVKLAELLSGEVSNVEKSFPVIRHAQLTRIIRNEHLDLDEDELKQAVSFLHESGVLLHYDETTLQMRDFYFINPGWLCRMMAQVVTVPEINPFINRDGVMKRNSAYMLFTGKTIPGGPNFIFPPSLIPQYLHLLEKFEIALPRSDDELLIPCRLPIMKPQFSMPQLARKDMAYRYYSMPYVPIGFWSRLLTRLIVFAQSKFIKDAFFLVDGCRGDTEEVHVTVPASSQGARLLGYLVDHVDSLVDEWYPGLTCIDPVIGHELLQKFVPCTTCTGHLFLFDDLVSQSETCDTVFCPQHDADVSLAQLAPDIMLTDIETNFRLDLDSFEFKDSPENLLGGGGFGSVYKATYKGQMVATKVFSAIGDIHPHKMLRQEATIMRRLKHPSVVSLVAVAQRPHFLMVMEFAPCGSLAHVLHTQVSLSRSLQHKIILQVGGVGWAIIRDRWVGWGGPSSGTGGWGGAGHHQGQVGGVGRAIIRDRWVGWGGPSSGTGGWGGAGHRQGQVGGVGRAIVRDRWVG